MKHKRFTTEEDSIILDAIAASPGNLKYAFEMAANDRRLKGRTVDAISGRYYGTLKSQKRAMVLVTKGGMISNSKNTKRPAKKTSMAMDVAEMALEKLSKEERKVLVSRILSED